MYYKIYYNSNDTKINQNENNSDKNSISKSHNSCNLNFDFPNSVNFDPNKANRHDNINNKKNDINETVFFIWFPETREWIWTIEIKHPLVQCESRLHPGTKIPFLNDHIKSTMRSSEADKTAVHVGTNDLASDEITMQIYKDIIRLVASIRNDNINPVIS